MMNPFGSRSQTVKLPPPKDTLGQSIMRGFGVSFAVAFVMFFITPLVHLPATLAGQVLGCMLMALAFLTMVTGVKAGRIIQAVTIGVLQILAQGLFALIKMIFSGIAHLLSRRPSNTGSQ